MKQNKEFTKRKLDLMKSIFSNPKLSKTLQDALNSPIGSTKRDQAKSTLSVLKKLHNRNDGRGGPELGATLNATSTPSMSSSTIPTYDNVVPIPAVTLKSTLASDPGYLKKGWDAYSDFMTKKVGPSIGEFGAAAVDTLGAAGQWGVQNAGAVASNIGKGILMAGPGASDIKTIPFVGWGDTLGMKDLNNRYGVPNQPAPASSGTKTTNGPVSGGQVSDSYGTNDPRNATSTSLGTDPSGMTKEQIMAYQQTYVDNGFMSKEDMATGPGTWGPKTQAAYLKASGADTSGDTTGTTGGNTGGNTRTSDPYGIQSAIDSGTGAVGFAMDFADEKFGGGLDQYIAKLDAKLKTDFNLKPLEQELTDLKDRKANLIPTLTQFMKSKDQYLKFIDSMIDTTNENMLNRDLSNPAVMQRFNNYNNYLVTLKGRQESRYGNYLTTAVADYTAELDRAQSNYDTNFKEYQAAMTQQGTMAQNTYNNLLARMQSIYTEQQNAPMLREQLAILKGQRILQDAEVAKAGFKGVNITDEDYQKNLKAFIDYNSLGVQGDGTGDKNKLDINWTKVPVDSEGIPVLSSLFSQEEYSGNQIPAASEGLRVLLTNSLKNAVTDDEKAKIFKAISNLQSDPTYGPTVGTYISTQMAPGASSGKSAMIQNQLPAVKKAVNSLINSGGMWWWKTPAGLSDKENWMKNNSTLSKTLLDSIYTGVQANYDEGTKNTFLADMFQGSTPEEQAKSAANII